VDVSANEKRAIRELQLARELASFPKFFVYLHVAAYFHSAAISLLDCSLY
jgi:hypothetical protein